MTTRALPIEQDTDLVSYEIEVNGAPMPNLYPLLSLEVIHEANRIPYARLTFADGDAASGEWVLSNEPYFTPGNEITILAGYHNQNEPIFSGIVISQSLKVRSQQLSLRVVCKDKNVQLTTTKKSRHFIDSTDSDAVRTILGEYEINADDVADTTITHPALVQYDACDWDFMVMRMEANGLVCLVDGAGFHAITPALAETPVATVQLGATVIEFDANLDARRQYGEVTAQAWDPAAQGYAQADGSAPTWTTNGDLTPAGLATATGAHTQQLKHSAALPVDELQQWSNATLLRSRMAFIRGRVRTNGLAVAKPGATLELAGFGDHFNGLVWISAVRHEISQGEWISDIEFGLSEEWHAQRYQLTPTPAQGLLSAVSGLHTGIVTALAGDPLNEYRVRVKIPGINLEDEGIWARIATLDAGATRGSFFRPEINDEVVVGFMHDDPRHPVVLGMLHSSALPPPEEPADDNHLKGFYSRTGIRIHFDDENTILTLDTPGGHAVVLDDDAGEVSLADSHGNTVLLNADGITLESAADLILKAAGNVQVEGQSNLELKAGAQWKAEGSAGAEINSSGITVVKGSLVQIN